jgi:hypothetical protein
MAWTLYRVTWRLESPLHSGFAKLGNIQRTRLYVTGRMLWGALTARLTRDQGRNDYDKVGAEVNKCLKLSYGYLALTEDGTQPVLPAYTAEGLQFKLGNHLFTERDMQRLCLTSYGSTALDYSNNTAVDGSLHEIEFISPRALCRLNPLIDEGAPLYLTCLIAESDEASTSTSVKGWKQSIRRLQIGGERNYGFGRMESHSEPVVSHDWWGAEFVPDNASVKVQAGGSLPAHTRATSSLPGDQIHYGNLEPMVGRYTTPNGAFGQDVRSDGICWQPGTTLRRQVTCRIDDRGIWIPLPEQATSKA